MEHLVDHIVVITEDEGERSFSLGGVKEGGSSPLRLIKHHPCVEVKVVLELILKLCAYR